MDVVEALVNLLSERCNHVEAVGKLKKQYGVPPLDSARWQRVLEAIKSQAKGKTIPEKILEQFFEAIHHYALKMEGECEEHKHVKEKDAHFTEALEKLRQKINTINTEVTNLLDDLYCSLKQGELTSIIVEIDHDAVMVNYFNSLFAVFSKEVSAEKFIGRQVSIKVSQKMQHD